MIQASLAVALASSIFLTAAANTPAVNVPPPADFFNQSWKKMNDTTSYKVVCTTIPGTVIKNSNLTEAQQANADLLVSAVTRLAQKETDIVMGKDKKASATREKTPSLLPYLAYVGNSLTYEQAQSYTEKTPQFSIQFAVNSQGLYYHAKPTDPWKLIKSKDLAKSMLENWTSSAITSAVDQKSMHFDSWRGGKPALAVYKGKLSGDGVQGVITDSIGKTFADDSNQNEATIYIDKTTKTWNKMEAVITVNTGSVTFPLIRTCQFFYGSKDAKVTIPTKVTSVDAKTGANEFMQLVNYVQ